MRPVSDAITHVPSLDFRIWRTNAAVMDKPHTHPDVEVNFLLRGTIHYLLAGRFVDIAPGEIALFWAGMPHQTLSKSSDVEGIWMTLPLIWLLRWKHTQQMAENLLRGQVIQHKGLPADEERYSEWERDFTAGHPALRDIIVGEIESRFSRTSLSLKVPVFHSTRQRLPAGSSRIEHILGYLATHYREELAVDDIAKAVRLHPKYLLALFRRTCQMTLWEYVLRLRLGHAQRLLLTTDRTVADIAFAAGFNSLSAFYHAFRRYVPARTPAAFRSGHAL